jgi:DNA repair exonuclease SbcCD ATPase subunit
MKFCTLEMKGIRHFTHKKIDFSNGLNIVCGPNESGKSTILDSLLASLIYPSHRKMEAMKQWDASHSEISLTYTTNDHTFTVNRMFQPEHKDVLKGENLRVEDTEDIQSVVEEHTGFSDRTLFENSAVVRQNEMQILQEADSRMKIRDKVRTLLSGVPERSTDEALEFLENEIRKAEQVLKDTNERISAIEKELTEYKGITEEYDDVQTRLEVYERDLARDQSILTGYDILLSYRQAEKEYHDLRKIMESVENCEGYIRKLPIREKELVEELQRDLEELSAQQDALIEEKRVTREHLRTQKNILTEIDDELEAVTPEKGGILNTLTSLFKRSSRSKQEELAGRRVEVSQNVGRLEDTLEQYDEKIIALRKKFSEKGERLERTLEYCKDFQDWTVEMMEAKKQDYESQIIQSLDGRTKEELSQTITAMRTKADDLRAQMIKTHPDLKDRHDIERITIEKEKLAEIITEWEEKIRGLKAQMELLSNKKQKRESLGEELEILKKERKEWAQLTKADSIAHDVITLAYQELKGTFAPELEHRAASIFKRVTKGKYTSITVREEDLEVLVEVPGKREPVPVDVLSQGTKDQLYLSLRIALSELLSGDKNPPMLFDEAFYTFDEERLQEALGVLEELARTTQVIVFTHDEAYTTHGTTITLERNTSEDQSSTSS